MTDFETINDQPWKLQSENIQKIVIDEEITIIGKNSFNALSKVTLISLSSTIETIGSYAFQSSGITSITIPSTVSSIGELVLK
jgi:hypothetical protein